MQEGRNKGGRPPSLHPETALSPWDLPNLTDDPEAILTSLLHLSHYRLALL